MKKKKSLILVILLLIIAISTTVGTVAWLTMTDELVNEFVIGSIVEPTTIEGAPAGYNVDEDAFLFEASWDGTNNKLLPGATYAKDPQVGIGAGSEKAYIYIYVDNAVSEKAYFELDENWVAVDAEERTFDTTVTGYTKGLFRYNEVVDASTADVWTTALFDEINIEESATTSDFVAGNITVKALIHQAYSNDALMQPTEIDTIAKAHFASN